MFFQTPKDEILHWKNRALSLESELNDTRLTLDDFQISSRELEEELERELRMIEAQNQKLKTQNQSLALELDTLTQKHQSTCLSSNQNILSLQKELETLREGYERIQRKAINLEMDNEELESFKRAAHSSMLDMERKHNEARVWKERYELENTKRNRMKEEIQRLKDELQDLENELCVARSNSPISPTFSPTLSNSPSTPTPCKGMSDEAKDISSQFHPQSPTPPSPVPTARRVSEYRRKGGSSTHTIQEIMERVKVLENRLISCRSIVKPLLPNFRTDLTITREATLPPLTHLIPKPKQAGEPLAKPDVWQY